ncbi:MAG: glycoside hydrolase family 32 protein [Phycisphaerae bacterium]|nr:glycoside hydrolase family 32 protein [Phycisphaerae bacterium]
MIGFIRSACVVAFITVCSSFILADNKPAGTVYLNEQKKEIKLTRQYILFPIQNGAKKAQIDLIIDGKDVRQFDAEIAVSQDKVSFWAFLDITKFKGKVAILKVNGVTQAGLAMIVQSDKIPGSEEFYKEILRPQFHFSQKIGWNNDPNGMVYYNGLWHLYFQHNPYGWKWGNMHWGHAVSKDLVHWEQLPVAIYNYRRGDWAFSGGATVDVNNTAGWQTGKEKTIVASWTSTGRGECVAYSNDDGTTFTEYEGNPVVKHKGRDPKIIWYEPGKHWVMAVYDESKEFGKAIAIYNSKDMKNWELKSKVPGYYECAEIFELPVDGDKNNTRWVIFAADAQYAYGTFDGQTFTPDHKDKHRVHYGRYYASQLFSNAPDGRKIQIGWARIDMPGMPFNQTFSFPHELTLRTTEDGIRMFAEPVKEIEKIYKKTHSISNKKIAGNNPAKLNVSGDIFDITAEFELEDAERVGLYIGGNVVTYNVKARKLDIADLKPVDGKIKIRVLVDRPMMEVIGNDGRAFITTKREVKGIVRTIEAFASEGSAKLIKLEVNELDSIWRK